jgi:O-antigen ligase
VLAFLVQTGSRSALVACAVGMFFYTKALSIPRRNLVAAVLVIAALVAGGYFLLNDRETMARWAQTVYEGDTAGRDRIFTGAAAMISERPFLGWGPVAYRIELNRRYDGTEAPRDAHNLILNLMLETGLFGSMMFLFGVLSCLRAALRSRKGRLGSTPLALVMFVCVFLLFQPWMASKPFWFVLAVAVAAAGGMQRYPVRPRARARFSRRVFPVQSPSVAFAFHLAGNGQPQPPEHLQNPNSPDAHQDVWNRRPLSS